jgi:hypothetical protein
MLKVFCSRASLDHVFQALRNHCFSWCDKTTIEAIVFDRTFNVLWFSETGIRLRRLFDQLVHLTLQSFLSWPSFSNVICGVCVSRTIDEME